MLDGTMDVYLADLKYGNDGAPGDCHAELRAALPRKDHRAAVERAAGKGLMIL